MTTEQEFIDDDVVDKEAPNTALLKALTNNFELD